MQQVIIVEPRRIEIRDVPVPHPAAGEIVIRVSAALTCGTDLKAYQRGHALIPMPGPFGHEFSGTVAGMGKGVRNFRTGDSVMGVHSAPCRSCRYCRRKLYNLCESIMEDKALGAFAEYLLLPSRVVQQNLFQKPDDLSSEEAALLEPFSCVVHAYNKYDFDETENALVCGAGPIGLMHLVYLRMKNVQVIVSDISESRRAIAIQMGASHAVMPEDVHQQVNELTHGHGVDLAVECTGQKGVWEESVNYTRRGGAVVLFGGCPSGTKVMFDAARLHYDELSLCGSFHYTPQDVRYAYRMLTEKQVDLYPLLSGEFPLIDIEKAFDLLGEGKGIKYVLRP